MMDEIIRYRDSKIKQFVEDPRILEHFLRSDITDADDYAGREILELLQNAIDPKGDNKKIRIQLRGNILTFSNTGEPFDVKGIQSLMISHTSEKIKDSSNIGYKGVGFRSVLNLTNNIEIHSGEINVRFSEFDAKSFASKNGLDELPMMMVPVEIDSFEDNRFDTNIVIRIKDDNQLHRIKNQICDLNSDTFLFLKDTFKYLEIEIDGHEDKYRRSREDLGDGEARVNVELNDEKRTLREFYKDLQYDDKDCRIAIIYDPDSDIDDNKLYSYFETDIDFPTKWRVHGTFDLSDNRNYLIKNDKNKFLLQEIVDLICESSVKISESIDYKAFEILDEHGRFTSNILEDADLNYIYEQAFSRAEIFPTVHGKYVSYNDGPVFYKLNLQKYISDMPESDDLLLFTKDEELQKKLSHYCTTYTLETISDYLNKIIDRLSPEDRVICSKLLMNLYYYNYASDDDFQKDAPIFFVDSEGKQIKNGQILIESKEYGDLKLPSFLNLRYLDKTYTSLLLSSTVSSDNHAFVTGQTLAKAYGIKEADIKNILSELDKKVKNDETLIPAYVKWLYENRDYIPTGDYLVLNELGQPCHSDNVYFGKSYSPESELDKIYDKSKIIADPSVFGIDKDNKEEFAGFLKTKLRVADMPRHDGYDIDGLPSILQYGSTKFVINLLLLNKDLLSSPSSNIQNSQQRLAKLVNTIQSSCWITYKRKRFAPNDVLLTSRTPYLKMGKYLDNILVISKDDLLKDIDDLSGSNKMWLLEEFLNFKQDLRDFNNSTIYKILNMLPDFDLDGTISEAAFNDIILKNDDRIKPTESDPEFYQFINSGKVYCFDEKYHAVKDCLYLREDYPKVIESQYNFVHLSKEKSSEAVSDRLGIETLSVEYELDKAIKSSANSESFRDDINNLKIAMLSQRVDAFNDEQIESLKRLEIVLCDDITILFNGQNGRLEEYEYVSDEDKYYVNIPNISYLNLKKNDTKFQAAIGEIFARKYKFEKDAIAYLVSLDMSSRENKIIDEFGRDKWIDAQEKLTLTEEDKNDYSDENIAILKNLRVRFEDEYSKRLYSSLVNEKSSEKRKFIEQLKNYRTYNFTEGDVPTNKDADLKEYLYKVFPIFTLDIIWNNIDIDAVRKQTVAELRETFSKDLDILDQLLDDPEYDSLARFGEISEIQKEMLYLLEKQRNIKAKDAEDSEKDDVIDEELVGGYEEIGIVENGENNVNNDSGTEKDNSDNTGRSIKPRSSSKSNHFDYRKLRQEESGTVTVDFSDIKPRKAFSSNSASAQKTIMSPTAKKQKETQAKIAEKEALDELKKLGYTEIKWMSAYAKEEDVNPDGGDGYGYDIIACKDGQVRYIEVKSSGSTAGVQFEMSENEFAFCDANPDNYDIAYVFAMNTNKHRITIIENVRQKLSSDNMIPNSYKVTLK